jgi:hypothetical protein
MGVTERLARSSSRLIFQQMGFGVAVALLIDATTIRSVLPRIQIEAQRVDARAAARL